MGLLKTNNLGIHQRENQDLFVGKSYDPRESDCLDPEPTRTGSGGPLIFHHSNDWDENTFAGTNKSHSEPDIEAQRIYYPRVPHNNILTRKVMPDIPPSRLRDRAPTSSLPSPTTTPTKFNSSAQLEAEVRQRQLGLNNSEMSNKKQSQSSGGHVLEHQGQPPIDSSRDLLWQQIQRLRVDTWSMRSRVHRIRAVLREKQRAKSAADDLLFQNMSKQLILGLTSKPDSVIPGEKTIANLMQACQETRDEYGPLEDDCNQLEDRLSAQEFRLMGMEESFYNRSGEALVLKSEDDTKIPPSTELPREPTVSLDSLDNIKFHPLVTAFLSRLGDLDLLRESLDDLVEEREGLEEERSSRQRTGQTLETNDQLWLDSYQTEEDSLLGKIHSAENEVESLRKDCISRGLIDENDEPTDLPSQEQVSFSGEEHLNSKNEISEYVKYPLLLPHPGIKQDELEAYSPKPDQTSVSTTTRINKWILDQLRTSALDVRLLASTFEGKGGEINDQWQHWVLSVWYNDETFKDEARIHVYASSMTTRATSPSKKSYASLNKSRNSSGVGDFIAFSHRLPSEHSDATQLAVIMGSLSV
jgi:hypothetical protein